MNYPQSTLRLEKCELIELTIKGGRVYLSIVGDQVNPEISLHAVQMLTTHEYIVKAAVTNEEGEVSL